MPCHAALSFSSLVPSRQYQETRTKLHGPNETIDDFLADYKHESSSIQSFMSCLDESETSHSADRSFGIQTMANTINPTSKAASPRPDIGRDTSSLDDTFPSERCKRAKSADSADSPLNVFDSWNVVSDNVNMSDDERRRIRNREYQRRFREKKIRREQQRLSMATSSGYAFRPHAGLEH